MKVQNAIHTCRSYDTLQTQDLPRGLSAQQGSLDPSRTSGRYAPAPRKPVSTEPPHS